MIIYSVHDNKAMSYMTPFFSPNDATAQRVFTDACLDTETQLAKHPNDFSLYSLASFDPISGKLEPFQNPTQIITAVAVVNQFMVNQSLDDSMETSNV